MNSRIRHALAVLGLLLLPIILLWPCLVGDRTFVPWDIAQFPPARTLMTDAQYADVTRNNNTDITEIPVMFLPELEFIVSEIKAGRVPHWNPYARSGTTVWASSILGVWYPLNWIMLLEDDPADALALGAFLSIAIAMLLMYGLLVHFGLSVPGALFGALAFGISGTLTVNLHFYQRINALIWLPGILWAISATSKGKGAARLPGLLGLAGCMFMTHTAGFPPYALVATLVAIAFCLLALAVNLPKGAKETFQLALMLAAGAALGVMIAAIQSIPMFEFFPESNRTMQAAGNSLASGGYDPAGLLGYLCPTMYTHPHINHIGGLRDTFSPVFWLLYSRGSWEPFRNIPVGTVFQPNLNFCEYTVFVGTPTLLLAFAGLFSAGHRIRWAVGFTLVFLFVLASAAHWFRPVLEATPFRWVPPTRYTGVACLFVAALAAFGIHALPNITTAVRRAIWTLGISLGALFLGTAAWVHWSFETPTAFLDAMTPMLREKYTARFPHVPYEQLPDKIKIYMSSDAAGAQRQLEANLFTSGIVLLLSGYLFLFLPVLRRRRCGISVAQILLVVMTSVELLRFGVPLNTGRELHGRPLNQTKIHEFLRQKRDEYGGSGGFSVVRAHDAVKRSVVPSPTQMPPDTLLNEHIRDQQAYTFVDKWSHRPILKIYGPSQLARNTWALSICDDERLTLPYWDMIGVRYILTEDELKHAGKRVGPELSGPPGAKNPTMHFYVYERENPLPRAWIVHSVKSPTVVATRETPDPSQDMVDAISAREFAPAQYALVDPDTLKTLGAPAGSKTPGNTRKVNFPILNETNTLTIDIEAGEKGYLVVNDTKMRGWTAQYRHADGTTEPATIHGANLFQRLVEVPAGAVTVEFNYTTPGFVTGLSLTLGGVVVWLGLFGMCIVSRRRRKSAEVTS